MQCKACFLSVTQRVWRTETDRHFTIAIKWRVSPRCAANISDAFACYERAEKCITASTVYTVATRAVLSLRSVCQRLVLQLQQRLLRRQTEPSSNFLMSLCVYVDIIKCWMKALIADPQQKLIQLNWRHKWFSDITPIILSCHCLVCGDLMSKLCWF